MALAKKHIVIVLFLVLSLMPASFAEETVISNTTYTSGTTLSLNEGDYKVYVGAGNITTTQIINAATNESYFLSEGDCKKLGSEKLCYEQKTDNKVRLSVIDLAASADISITCDKTGTLKLGDRITATIRMNNSGETTAEDVRMLMPLHENLSVTTIRKCSYNRTHVHWSGELPRNGEMECVIGLRVDGPLETTLEASMTYTTFGESHTKASDDHEFETESLFSFTINVSPTSQLEPGQPFIISFMIRNEDKNDNLSLEPFELLYDEGLEFLLTDIYRASTRNGRTYVYKDLANGSNYTGNFKLAPTLINHEGTFRIGFTYNTTDDGELRTFYRTYTYDTIELPLIIKTEPEDLTFESFATGTINITVTNPYRYLTFKGYDVDVTLALGGERVRQRVPYQRTRTVAMVPYTIPDTAAYQQETLTVGVIARTDTGQAVEAQEQFKVTLVPLQPMLIEKVVGPQSTTNQATTIDVYATNHHQAAITVDFKERIPEGLFARGTIETTKTLPPGERLNIYSYELLATGAFPAEANTTTTYAYTYLGNTIEREETAAVTAAAYEPTPTQPEEANETIITPPELVQRQQPSIVHIIIAASVLLVFVTVIIIWEWMRHIHAFRINHKSLLKQYQSLINESESLRRRKQELFQEQHLMSRKLDVVERHLEGYDKHLPDKIADLEQRKRDIKTMESAIKERHDELKKRMIALKEKEDRLIAYEHNFDELLKRIENRESNLKQDDDLLHQDIKSLMQDQTSITQQLDSNLKQQRLMQDRIKHFKAKHAANLNSKITILASRKKQVMDYHNQLEQEEDKIKQEFEKMQQDLELSMDDLSRAEKLYKQATVQLEQGQHEAQQAISQEHRPG